MTTEQQFVLSLYPHAYAIHLKDGWHIKDSDGTNLSIGWSFERRHRQDKEWAWADAADSLNYEMLRKLEHE